MKIKDIKVGRMYQTKLGIGECLTVGGTFPPSVRINIKHPMPLGVMYVQPKDVLHEISVK